MTAPGEERMTFEVDAYKGPARRCESHLCGGAGVEFIISTKGHPKGDEVFLTCRLCLKALLDMPTVEIIRGKLDL